MTTPTTVNVRLQLRADTAANWTAANPILLANEVGLETDTKKLKVGNGSTAWNSLAYFPSIVSGGTVLGNLEIGSTGTLTFEGSTADGFETTLAVTNPTADRTITLPNQSGTVVVSGNASIVDADIAANAEIAVSKLADGAARQLLQTDAAGTGVEWTSNVDIPGTLDVSSTATFDGDVTVTGNLTVNGTTTNINTNDLVVEDKNIILGDVATPSDVTADGGGITLKGTTDKTINWVDATDAWTSSERFSVPLGSEASPSLTFTGYENTGIYSPGADQLVISTNGTGRLFVDATGNVSVGASSSDGLLHANGGTITSTRAAAFGSTILRRSEGSTASPAAISTNAELGRVSYRGYDGASYQQVATIGGFSDGAITSTSAPGYLEFYTTPSGSIGPVPRLRVTSDGKVGIGTTSPQAKLAIVSTRAADVLSLASYFDVNGSTGDKNRFVLGCSSGSVRGIEIIAEKPGSNNAHSIIFSNSRGDSVPQEAARIDTSGTFRVKGAGTAGVNDAFAVNGSAPANSAQIDTSGRLLVGTSTDSGGALLQINGNRIRIATAKTPASATDTGVAGEVCWDSGYIYVCTATNTWKRAALATW